MTQLQENIDVADQLELALGGGRIPSKYHQWGAHLLTHLRRPIQIAFVGQPKSGKSSLISMMIGRQDIPTLGKIATVEIVHGPQKHISLEHADGSVEHHDWLPAEVPLSDNIVRARLELPEKALLNRSFTKLRLSGSPLRQENLLRHVAQSAAILVYCSEEFGESEQRIWANAPEEIKDHSFLALTMADRQIMKGRLNQRISQLESVVSEEFLGLYPIATLQAIAARSDSVTIRPDLWTSSGGKDFHDALEHQIDRGRMEDLDKAGMLLAQFAADLPGQRPDQKFVAPRPEQNQITAAEPQAAVSQVAEHEAAEVLKETLNMLQKCADDMLQDIPEMSEPNPSQIIEKCARIIGDLSDTLAHADCGDPVIKSIQEDAREGEEMMLLLQLEKGEDAASDAVVSLMQLKKEISKNLCG